MKLDCRIFGGWHVDNEEGRLDPSRTTPARCSQPEVRFDNPWALFDVYLDEVAETRAEATIPAWQDVLGGVDVFTESHCWAMVESLRID